MSRRGIAADGPRLVVQAWLGSRLLIAVVALLIAARHGLDLLDLVNRWDAQLYGKIAAEGYLAEPNLMAFFPGLPLLMRAGLLVGVPTQVTGVVTSLLGSAVAAAALVRLAGQRTHPERGYLVAAAWLCAPVAVFTTVPYTESLFCAAAFWAWERARARDWGWAAVLAAVATSIRVSGVFLITALAVLALTQAISKSGGARPRLELRKALLGWAWLLIPVGVIVFYFGYLFTLTGEPFAWFHAQQDGWARGFTWPWQSAINTWDIVKPGAYPDNPWWPPVFRMEVVSMVLGVVATGWCLGRRRWAEAVWIGLQVLAFSTSYWFMSVNRATLLWFPLWIMLIELASLRPRARASRWAHHVVVAIAGAGMIAAMMWWCWLFFTGRWAS